MADALARHLSALVGERDPFTAPERHGEVRRYIEEALSPLGPVRRHTFAWPVTPLSPDPWRFRWRGLSPPRALEGVNLVLELGGVKGGPAVLVGAHYDAVPGSPGADDNASGVAVLLELARRCAHNPPPVPLIFVAFDLEEWGMVGSRALAGEMRREGRPLHLMLSLEMVGVCRREPRSQKYPFPFGLFYPHRGDFLLLLGDLKAHRKMARLARALGEAGVRTERFTMPLRGWPIPPSRWSDHSPFWDAGYPAVLLTDTAWLRNPHYHRPSDTPETLDLEFMAGIVEGLLLYLHRFARQPPGRGSARPVER